MPGAGWSNGSSPGFNGSAASLSAGSFIRRTSLASCNSLASSSSSNDFEIGSNLIRASAGGASLGVTRNTRSECELRCALTHICSKAVPTRAKDCLAAPNSPAPEGKWWYYRLDWPTQRRCRAQTCYKECGNNWYRSSQPAGLITIPTADCPGRTLRRQRAATMSGIAVRRFPPMPKLSPTNKQNHPTESLYSRRSKGRRQALLLLSLYPPRGLTAAPTSLPKSHRAPAVGRN